MDFEAEYNNRARVPGHGEVMARWKVLAEAARVAYPPGVIAYGPGARERMDVFDAGPAAPVAVFLHGGYWQALGREWFSGIAPPLLAHGITVVIPSYDLAPDVRVGAILGQVRTVMDRLRADTGRRPLVFGHSAGGHMAAAMLSEGRAGAALALSGVFDLEPLIDTSLNDALRLDRIEARALSPVHWPAPNGGAPGGTALDCWVGGDESGEFIRQSRDMAQAWTARGAQARFGVLPGLNHFTVLDPLFEPGSALVARIVELASAPA